MKLYIQTLMEGIENIAILVLRHFQSQEDKNFLIGKSLALFEELQVQRIWYCGFCCSVSNRGSYFSENLYKSPHNYLISIIRVINIQFNDAIIGGKPFYADEFNIIGIGVVRHMKLVLHSIVCMTRKRIGSESIMILIKLKLPDSKRKQF